MQQKGYDFPTDAAIFAMLSNLQFISVRLPPPFLGSAGLPYLIRHCQDENKLWAMSLAREPRNVERASDLP